MTIEQQQMLDALGHLNTIAGYELGNPEITREQYQNACISLECLAEILQPTLTERSTLQNIQASWDIATWASEKYSIAQSYSGNESRLLFHK